MSQLLGRDLLFLFLIYALFGTLLAVENPCENQPNGVFIRDPDDCSKFFQCRRGVPLTAFCPDGMYFDPKQSICDIAENVFCEHDHINPNNDEKIECPVENPSWKRVTFVPSKINCNRYYICYHGRPIMQECIKELHWNSKTMKCDFPERAHCTANEVKCNDEFTKHTLPHPNNCNLYFYCIYGMPLLQRCPYYHHFDIKTRTCKWENRATCWSNEIENKKRLITNFLQ